MNDESQAGHTLCMNKDRKWRVQPNQETLQYLSKHDTFHIKQSRAIKIAQKSLLSLFQAYQRKRRLRAIKNSQKIKEQLEECLSVLHIPKSRVRRKSKYSEVKNTVHQTSKFIRNNVNAQMRSTIVKSQTSEQVIKLRKQRHRNYIKISGAFQDPEDIMDKDKIPVRKNLRLSKECKARWIARQSQKSLAKIREADAEYKRCYKQSFIGEQLKAYRATNSVAQRARRNLGKLTSEQLDFLRAQCATSKQWYIEKLTPKHLEELQATHEASQQKLLEKLTPDQLETYRAAQAASQRWHNQKAKNGNNSNLKIKEICPYLANECDDLEKGEMFRRQIISEISNKIAQIQKGGIGKIKISEMEDDLIKLLREKGYWEDRIKALGGPDYWKNQQMIYHEDREISDSLDYRAELSKNRMEENCGCLDDLQIKLETDEEALSLFHESNNPGLTNEIVTDFSDCSTKNKNRPRMIYHEDRKISDSLEYITELTKKRMEENCGYLDVHDEHQIKLETDEETLTQFHENNNPGITNEIDADFSDGSTRNKMTIETPQQRERRLEKARQKRLEKISNESPSSKQARLAKNRQNRSRERANETKEQRELRLLRDRERHAAALENETYEQRELRLLRDRERHAAARKNATTEQREFRLNSDRKRHAAAKNLSKLTKIFL